MNWEQYKQCCDRGDVLSRFLLEETEQLLQRKGKDDLAARLRAELAGVPLPRPSGYRGGRSAEMFRVTLTPDTLQQVLCTVAAGRAAGDRTSGGRHLGGFVEAWQECLDWQLGRHPRSPRPDSNS